jgi:hypothetical protein
MDEFGYLSVLLSIILGLAVTQILQGFRGLLLSRARVQFYWPVIAWAFLLLLACFQSWWAMFGLRSRHDWTFPAFAVVLLQIIFLYMSTGLIFPDFAGDTAVDLKKNFYAHHGWFFALAIAMLGASFSKPLIFEGKLPQPTDLAFHVIFGATFLVGAITRSERYHKTLVVFGIAGFVLYIVLLFTRLQ